MTYHTVTDIDDQDWIEVNQMINVVNQVKGKEGAFSFKEYIENLVLFIKKRWQ